MARPGLLRSDRRRVSGTHAFFLSDVINASHPLTSSFWSKNLLFLDSLSLSLSLQSTSQFGLDEVPGCRRLELSSDRTNFPSKPKQPQSSHEDSRDIYSPVNAASAATCVAQLPRESAVLGAFYRILLFIVLRHDLRCELFGTSYQTGCSTLVQCPFSHL